MQEMLQFFSVSRILSALHLFSYKETYEEEM